MQTVKLDFPDRDLYILKDGDWRGYRSRPCEKEPETVEWIRSFNPENNEHFWDIGASVGPYSLIAAALGNYVDAFEPFAPNFAHLCQNTWLNNMGDPIGLFPVFFDSYDFEDDQQGWDGFRGSHSEPGSASHGKGNFSHEVWRCSVDELFDTYVANMPHHVKIDVDGAEMGVIEGGRETWKKVQSIMIESEPPTIDDITVILHAAGLEMVDSWKRLGDTKQHNYLFKRGAG